MNYEDIGFSATPRLIANGAAISGTAAALLQNEAATGVRARDLGTRGNLLARRWNFPVPLSWHAGDNVIEIAGGEYALDIVFLEVTPKAK